MSNLETIKQKNVPLEIGGKVRNLRYDLNAFSELEETYGDLPKMLAALNSGSIKAVRKFLYVGFMHENENLTEKEVGSWFDISNIEVINSKITEAMSKALPEVENKEENKDEKDPNAKSPEQNQ